MVGVLAEARGGLWWPQRRGRHAVGVGRLGEPVARIDHERFAGDEVIQPFHVGTVGHRGVGDAERGGQVPDLIDGLLTNPRIELVGLLVGLLGDRQRRILVDPVIVTGHRTQVEPLLGSAATDVDQTVLGEGDAGHRQASRVAPGPAQHLVVADRVVGQPEDGGLELRHIDELGAATQPGGQRRRAGVGAGEIVADLASDVDRCPVRGPAAQADDPTRPGLQREFGRGLVLPRPLEPERGDRGDRQVRVALPDHLGCEPAVAGHARPPGPDDGVRTRQQGVDERVVGIRLGDHGAFRAGQEREQPTVGTVGDLGTRCRPAAQRVAFGWLDLDHLGATIGEQLRAVRAGDPAGQVDDDVAGKRRVRLRVHGGSSPPWPGCACSTGIRAGTCCRCR